MKKGNIVEVTFDEEEHKYMYQGKELNGITGIIGRRLGKSFPETAITEMVQSYGSQVHKESEDWINNGDLPSTESGQWVIQELKKLITEHDWLSAETRVSDFEGTASNVDIVIHTCGGEVYLGDIKTGNFDRQYCTMQLNAYRMMYENCYNEKVIGLFVLCSKSKRLFRILKTSDQETLKLLEDNK